MSGFDEMRALVGKYFDGLYDGNVEQLSGIFHARSRLHVLVEGELVEIEFEPYMELVRGRPSPRSLGAERRDRIVAIHRVTSTTGIVIVDLLLAGKSYTDQLSLLRDQGRWQIISKVYHLNTDSERDAIE